MLCWYTHYESKSLCVINLLGAQAQHTTSMDTTQYSTQPISTEQYNNETRTAPESRYVLIFKVPSSLLSVVFIAISNCLFLFHSYVRSSHRGYVVPMFRAWSAAPRMPVRSRYSSLPPSVTKLVSPVTGATCYLIGTAHVSEGNKKYKNKNNIR